MLRLFMFVSHSMNTRPLFVRSFPPDSCNSSE